MFCTKQFSSRSTVTTHHRTNTLNHSALFSPAENVGLLENFNGYKGIFLGKIWVSTVLKNLFHAH